MGYFGIELVIGQFFAAIKRQQVEQTGDQSAVFLHADIGAQDIVGNRFFALVDLLGDGSLHHPDHGSAQADILAEAIIQAGPHHVSLIGLKNGVVLKGNLDRFGGRKEAGVDNADLAHHVIHRIILSLAQESASCVHSDRTLGHIGGAQADFATRSGLVLPN